MPVSTVHQGCLVADIVFVADFSGSMAKYSNLVSDAFKEFSANLDISEEGIRVGFVSFTGNVYLDLVLTGDENEVINFENKLTFRESGGSTELAPALAMAKQVFLSLDENRFSSSKKVIVFISDGQTSGADYTADSISAITESWELRKLGVDVYVIDPQTIDSHPMLLHMIATTDDHYIASDYASLAEAIKKLNFCM